MHPGGWLQLLNDENADVRATQYIVESCLFSAQDLSALTAEGAKECSTCIQVGFVCRMLVNGCCVLGLLLRVLVIGGLADVG
jgi:hypothetical protein